MTRILFESIIWMEKKSLIISASGLKNIVFTQEDEFKFIFGEKEIKMNHILADFISPRVYNLHRSDPTIAEYNFDDIFHSALLDQNSMKIFRQIRSKRLIVGSLEEEEEEHNDLSDEDETTNKENQQTSEFYKDAFDEATFDLLIRISSGYVVDIDEKMAVNLQILSIAIGNEELFQSINKLFPQTINEANLDLYLLYLQNSKNNQFFPLINEEQAIEYISSNFYLIDQSDLMKLPKSILYMIISNDKLVIESEDSLIEFINDLFEENDDEDDHKSDEFNIISFYENIEFSELSENEFNEFLKKFDPNELTYSIWKKLNKCFYYSMCSSLKRKEEESLSTNSNRYYYATQTVKFPYNGNAQNRFNGIIHYLDKKYGGNVHDKHIVDITTSSTYVPSSSGKNAADFDTNHYFASNNEKEAWICYDFKDRKVRPTHYSLRSRNDCGKDGNHLKKWCIEGSNDLKNWVTLDSRKKEHSLNNANASNTFNIQYNLRDDDFFRYLRLKQVGRNTGENFHLNVSALEYFGALMEKVK